MRTPAILAAGLFALIPPGLSPAADPPGVVLTVADGPPGKTVYRFAFDRPAAERFRDTLATADAKQTADALAGLATDPGQKAILGLVGSNVEALKRAVAKDGAVGPNGFEILVTVTNVGDDPPPLIPGREGKRGPLRDFLRRAGRQVGEAVLNPWAWEVRPK